MKDANGGIAAGMAHTDEPPALETGSTPEIIPAGREKTPIWRLDLEPRRMVEEHRAFVSALAHGGE
jgi:hypothetical protein